MMNLYGNIDLMAKAMDASWKRNEMIANNIANVNTPGYKKQTVEFETHLKDALHSSKLPGAITHERHLPIGTPQADQVEPRVIQQSDHRTRRDGNNVDIDVEMANRAKNELQYQTLSTKLNSDLHRLRTVITEGSR